MASKALDELIAAVGKDEAVRLYLLVTEEYTTHVQKHLAAAAAENPAKGSEAAFMGDVLTRVKADKGIAQAIAEAVEDAPADGGRVR